MNAPGMSIKLAILIMAISIAVQAQGTAERPLRYRLFEIGTFGGANSAYNGGPGILTSNGLVVGAANTTGTDPYAPVCLFDPS